MKGPRPENIRKRIGGGGDHRHDVVRENLSSSRTLELMSVMLHVTDLGPLYGVGCGPTNWDGLTACHALGRKGCPQGLRRPDSVHLHARYPERYL